MLFLADLPGGDDTIVAIATPGGRGAVAMVRLSGARAIAIAGALGAPVLSPRRMTRVTVRRADDEQLAIDDALMVAYPAPKSYTGEDVVEIFTHGGLVVPLLVVAACVAAGARPAFAGEFTRRAVLNGRLDLLQAEAIADLIDARTIAMHRQALAQLDGGLSRRLLALRNDVIQLEALIAYDIDFPEEDDGPIAPARITRAARVLEEALDALIRTAPQAQALRDGVLVVIAGRPNAGKSSLFNALLGESRALVTPIAGTTRDAIEAVLDAEPLPLRLVDTAGLRETTDLIERLGIEVSARYLGQAQVVLACGTSPEDIAHACAVIRPQTDGVVLPVLTKSDLFAAAAVPEGGHAVSAERGDGVAALLLAVVRVVSATAIPAHDGASDVLVTRERHRAGLALAVTEVRAFLELWETRTLPAPVAAVHLLSAREALSTLIGVVETEAVLERVFGEFCVGK